MRVSVSLQVCVKPALLDILHNHMNDPTFQGLPENEIALFNLLNQYKTASISRINIDRTPKNVSLTINTSRPGLIIGKGGSEVDILKKKLKKIIGYDVQINVFEIKRPALVAKLVGESIAQQIEKKINRKVAEKQAVSFFCNF